MEAKTETPETLRAEAVKLDNQAEESFDRCDTDGFLSQWALGLTAQQKRAQANIVENGGKSSFIGLFTLDGKRVRAKVIKTHPPFAKWATQLTWAFCDANGKFTGKFITCGLKEKNLAKKGYKEEYEEAPAKAIIDGKGYGLSGSAWVAVIRLDKGYPEDAIDG